MSHKEANQATPESRYTDLELEPPTNDSYIALNDSDKLQQTIDGTAAILIISGKKLTNQNHD